MYIVLAVILGGIAASFATAIVDRLFHNESIWTGRSHCEYCGHTLRWFELIPMVSYWIQGRKSRCCNKTLPLTYGIAEIVLAALFVVIVVHVYGSAASGLELRWDQSATQALIYMLYTTWLYVVFVYDLRHFLILDVVTVPAMVVVAAIEFVLAPTMNTVQSLGLAAVVGGGLFAVQYVLSKGVWVGGGDIRLGIVMGLMLGWPAIITGLMVSYIIGAIAGVGLLLSGHAHRKTQLPFGTFLSVGAFIALLYHTELVAWYQGIILQLLW